MKKAVLLFFLILSIPTLADAQVQNTSDELQTSRLSFMPAKISSPTFSGLNTIFTIPTHSAFLNITGSLLYSLKFNSPMDQFTALKPFDARAFSASSVSDFEQELQNNYLLILKPSSLK